MNKTSDKSKPNAQISSKMHHSNTVTKGQARTKFISFNVVIGKERNWKLDSALDLMPVHICMMDFEGRELWRVPIFHFWSHKTQGHGTQRRNEPQRPLIY